MTAKLPKIIALFRSPGKAGATAKAFGLEIPGNLLVIADPVINKHLALR